MFINSRKFKIISIIAVLIVTSLACNFPSIPRLRNSESEVPVASQSAQELKENVQTAVGNALSGQPFELTITESQLTSYIALRLQSLQEPRVSEVQVHLQDGKAKITGKVEQDNFSLPLALTVSLSANANGKPEYEFEAAKIGPFPIPTSLLDELTVWMDEALSSHVLPGGKEIFFETINISNGQLFINGYAK